MGRIIVDNRSHVSDSTALELVSRIVAEGRVSNGARQYCYAVRFTHIGVAVLSKLNKKSDRFVVVDEVVDEMEEKRRD